MRGQLRVAFILCAVAVALPASGDRHDKWVEARSENFTVVSNAGEKQARKIDIQFEQIRALFRKYLPVAADHPSRPITILGAKDENTMKELLPEYWTKGHMHPAGVFFGGGSLQQQEVLVQADVPGPDAYSVIYHEYYHSLTLPYYPGMPLWLAEGLANFFGYSGIDGQKAYMGEVAPGLVEALRQNQLIPLNVLLNVNRTSPYYNENEKTGIFYAESWALTHYLWMADKASHRPALAAYLQAVTEPGVTQDQAAAKAFGDLRKLQVALQVYINGASFYRLEAPAPEVPEADIRVRDLSDAEADAYLGGFAALRGHPQDAKPLLEQAIKLDPNLAMAYANLGLADFIAGERQPAFESFSKAVSLDPKNALTHYFRAYLSLGQGYGAAGSEQFEDDLRQSIALDPNFVPPYVLLAQYLSQRDNVTEAWSFAKKAITLKPGDASALLTAAEVLVRMRKFNDAQTVAQWAVTDSMNAVERGHAEQVLNSIELAKSSSARSEAPADLSPRQSAAPGLSDSDTNESGGAAPAAAGTEHHTTGLITQSSCMNGSPQIQLQTDSGSITLHVAQGGALDIELSFTPPAGFSPCNSFKGYRADASYTLDDANGTRGTLSALRVLGPTVPGDTSAGSPGDGPAGGKSAAAPRKQTEGQVADVTCVANDMLVTLSASGRQWKFHTRDYSSLTYYDDRSGASSDGFLPCSGLRGRKVSIIYTAAAQARYDGEIQSVEIEK